MADFSTESAKAVGQMCLKNRGDSDLYHETDLTLGGDIHTSLAHENHESPRHSRANALLPP